MKTDDIYDTIERAQMLARISHLPGFNTKTAFRICKECHGKIDTLIIKLTTDTLIIRGVGKGKLTKLKQEFEI